MKNGIELFNKFSNVDAVLLSAENNTFYVAEYESTNAYVLLTSKECFYFTDDRYLEESANTLKGGYTTVRITSLDAYDKIKEVLKGVGAKRVGFEDNSLKYSEYIALKDALNDFELVGIEDELLNVRAVKTDKEIKFIEKAAKINDFAFADLLKVIKEGVTEKDIKIEMEYRLAKFGGDGLAFDTIVAFGKNTSKPHAHAGDIKLKSGMPVTIDFGSKYKGYCSDITRSFFFGQPTKRMVTLYNKVFKAQKLGLAAVKPDVKASDVDAACREYFKSKNVDGYFTHGTGHGVGIDIHECPTVNPRGNIVLKPGMVITVEPGLYIPNIGGIRIEDLVLVTEKGKKILSKTDKSLLIL